MDQLLSKLNGRLLIANRGVIAHANYLPAQSVGASSIPAHDRRQRKRRARIKAANAGQAQMVTINKLLDAS